MATIRVNRQAAHAGQLPQICICCGTPAQQFVRHEFRFEPTWLILLLTAFPKMWIFFSYDTFQLNLPVCSSHTTRFKWPSYAGLATVGLLFLMFVPIIAMYATGNQDKMIVMIPVCLLIIAGYVISRFVLLFGGPRVVQYSAVTLEIAGVSEGFAQHVSGRGVQPTQQYPPPQTYTGNYGVDQAAYQNAYRAPAGSSSHTLLIVALAVGIPVVLMGVVVLLALSVASSRNFRNRQWANQARRELAQDLRASPPVASQPGRPSASGTATFSGSAAPNSAAVNSPSFHAGEIVYFEAFSNWNKATIVSQNGMTCQVKYVDRFGREQTESQSANILVRTLPPGVTVSDRQAVVAAKVEPPASDFSPASSSVPSSTPSSAPSSTPSAAEGTEFQPGDTAYFEMFGKWYKGKIVRKLGEAYELTFYHDGVKREVPGVQQAKALRRAPPEGMAVIEGSGSAPERMPRTSSALGSQRPSKENPPGAAVTEASLKKGVKLFAWWGSKWWDAEVVSSRKGEVLVHYDGWGANFDEWLPLDRVRLKEATAEKK